ncbi:ABC transporter permease [Inquilinus limosus]|uniref:Diguanylate cyclase n=1 Tax=Inquilinus limosus MP06 TaxID=1398085 RepID=A0A0A0D7U9_9PROT|nr:ABC transporter permease [Inquilinus limosus]KGM34160.1 diguanylate cyclase [Inquilinus limosus MP06]
MTSIADSDDLPAAPSRAKRLGRILRRHKNLTIGGAMVLLLVLAGLLAPLIAPHDPTQQSLAMALRPPSAEHLFGTDQYGRDLFSRIVYGARLSLLEIVLGVGIALAAGIPLGLLAGYSGGKVDQVVIWFMDILFAFPGIVLSILIVSILGTSLVNLMIGIAVFSIPVYGRLSRNLALALKQVEYTEAARALGAGLWRILFQHILRNALGPIIVQATLTAGTVVLTAASLSFLGLGAQPPTPEWGAMMSDGRNFLGVNIWLSLFPGLAITFSVLGFNLFGDGLRDLLDPRR